MTSPGLVRVETECDGCRTKQSFQVANVVEGQHQLEDLGWLRNHKLDQDLCPTCAQARVGFYGVDKRLL